MMLAERVLPHWLRRQLCRFRSHEQGMVAVLFALAMVPTVTLTGLAIDFAGARGIRTKLQSAADAAVLESITQAQRADAELPDVADYVKTGSSFKPIERGEALFNDQLNQETALASKSIKIKVEKKGDDYTATATFKGKYKSILPGMNSAAPIEVEGSTVSKMSVSGSGYMDIYSVMDTSPSMGIGASPTDINRLFKETGCSFSCHGEKPPGVNLRIDILRNSVVDMIKTAKDSKKGTDEPRIRIGLFPFEGAVQQLHGLSDDYDSLDKAAKGLQIHRVSPHSTNIGGAMNYMNGIVPTSGSGLTKGSPKKFVFLVTDGLEDRSHDGRGINFMMPYTQDMRGGSINPQFCAALKAKGVTVAVLYTTYYRLWDDSWADYAYLNALPGIPVRLRECASPDFYFEATSGQQLQEQFKKMFKKAVNSTMARLSK